MSDPCAVEYRVLGPVEVVVGGVARQVPGYRRQLLLTALVLAGGREVPTDELIDLLWDDDPPRHPERALRSQVTRARHDIGPDASRLVFGAGGYALTTTALVDVHRFEDLASIARRERGAPAVAAADAALRLWRTTDLAFSRHRALRPAGVRLAELRATVVERRAELLILQGRAGDAVAGLHELLLARPERDATRALLMRALHVADRPTEALELYRSWDAELRERGLVPSGALRDLESRILRDEPAIAPATPMAPCPPAASEPVAPRAARTSFVGRAPDLEEVERALHEHRIVTLVGPGGAGKTRLAREVLARRDPRLGSLIEVELAAIEDPADVVRSVAGAIGVEDAAGRTLLEQVVEHLASGPHLVLLDNCEHVVDAVSAFVTVLITRTDDVTVLATTQSRLGVAGEWSWTVSPLAAGGPDPPAVALFLDRARTSSPELVLEDGDTGRIRRICEAVDGLPLGIEIAAAQTAALTLADLEDELEHRLELQLSSATGPARQRSLRSVIAWSFDRLDPREQRALARLSVFAGSFDLAAARSVLVDVTPPSEVAAAVVRLVARSLLTFDTHEGRGAYRMLQSVRAFGLDRLRADGHLLTAQARHAAWAVELAGHLEATLPSDERGVVRRLEPVLDDLRSAHRWLVVHDADAAARLIHSLHPVACWHGKTEVLQWADDLTSVCGPSLRPSLLASVCAGAWIRGDLRAAEQAAGAALGAITDPGSPSARRAYEQAGEVALQRGDGPTAVAMYDRAHQLCVLTGEAMQAVWDLGSAALILHYTGETEEADRRASAVAAAAEHLPSPSARAFAAFVLGELTADRDPRAAADHLHRAVELALEVDNQFVAGLARVTLATLAPEDGASVAATIDHYSEALSSWERTGAWFAQLVTLRSIVGLLVDRGAFEAAATLYGVVTAEHASSSLYGPDRTKLERTRAALDHALGEHRVRELATAGARLRRHEITASALEALADLARGDR